MSITGLRLLTAREGVRLRAYQDSVGVWTIGVGHTAAAGRPKPKRGMTITALEASEILANDLAQYEDAVERAIKRPMLQHEFDAMVSLCFNIGTGAFSRSTLVRKFNAGDKAGAAKAFKSWNRAGGRVIKGLVNRRLSEVAQFQGKLG